MWLQVVGLFIYGNSQIKNNKTFHDSAKKPSGEEGGQGWRGLSFPKARDSEGTWALRSRAASVNEAPRAGHVRRAPRSSPGHPNNLRERDGDEPHLTDEEPRLEGGDAA